MFRLFRGTAGQDQNQSREQKCRYRRSDDHGALLGSDQRTQSSSRYPARPSLSVRFGSSVIRRASRSAEVGSGSLVTIGWGLASGRQYSGTSAASYSGSSTRSVSSSPAIVPDSHRQASGGSGTIA